MRRSIALLLFLIALAIQPSAYSQSQIKWARSGHNGGITSLSVSPNDKFLVSASELENDVIIWSTETNSFVRRIQIPGARIITASAVLADNRTLVLSDQRGLHLVDMQTGESLRSLPLNGSRNAVYLNATTTGDTILFIGNSAQGVHAYRYSQHKDQVIDSLLVPDRVDKNTTFATSSNLNVLAYDARKYMSIMDIADQSYSEFSINGNGVPPDYFLSDSEIVMSHASYLHIPTLTLRDSTFPKVYINLSSAIIAKTHDHLRGFLGYDEPTADGKVLVGGIYEFKSDVERIDDNKIVSVLSGEPPNAMAIVAQNTFLFVAGMGGSARYDLVNGQDLFYSRGFESLLDIAYSPAGNRFAYRTAATPSKPAQILISDKMYFNDLSGCNEKLALDPIADRYAIGNHILEIDTSVREINLPCTEAVGQWSSDGAIFVWYYADNNFVIEDRQGNQTPIESGHAIITDLDISPDGSLIATSGLDSMVRIWSSNGKLLRTLSGHAGKVTSADFSDDRHVATCSDDGSVRLWSLSSGESFIFNDIGEMPLEVQATSDGSTIIVRTMRSVIALNSGGLLYVSPSKEIQHAAITAWRSNDQIVIDHNFKHEGEIAIEVFDILGRILLKSEVHSGNSTLAVSAHELPEQVVFVRVVAGEESAVAVVR